MVATGFKWITNFILLGLQFVALSKFSLFLIPYKSVMREVCIERVTLMEVEELMLLPTHANKMKDNCMNDTYSLPAPLILKLYNTVLDVH